MVASPPESGRAAISARSRPRSRQRSRPRLDRDRGPRRPGAGRSHSGTGGPRRGWWSSSAFAWLAGPCVSPSGQGLALSSPTAGRRSARARPRLRDRLGVGELAAGDGGPAVGERGLDLVDLAGGRRPRAGLECRGRRQARRATIRASAVPGRAGRLRRQFASARPGSGCGPLEAAGLPGRCRRSAASEAASG